MGQEKSRMKDATLKIEFEGDSRAFDANHPICGAVVIDSKKEIAAYAIQVKVELVDVGVNADQDSKDERSMRLKRVGWEQSKTIHQFRNDASCPAGQSRYPFVFDLPPTLPQSMYVAERFTGNRLKLKYFLKAQLVPFDIALLNNGWGKCQLRDRQRILVSPVRPLVNDPCFDFVVPFEKQVGLTKSTPCRMQITMSKNFFIAGEIVYMMVNIDNSECVDACSLEISHKTKYKMYQCHSKESYHRNHKKERFFLCEGRQSKQLILQFQLASKRVKAPGTGFYGKHAAEYYNLGTFMPESIHAQTFSIENYLQFNLSHASTIFSEGSSKHVNFQLIQPSLVPGVVEVAPPIFLDKAGDVMLEFAAPDIAAPEGEIVRGTVMDFDEPKDKGDK